MSKNNNKEKAKSKQTNENVVKMKFKEHKFYRDMSTPHYYAGQVYEIEGADQIQRWLKRGGEIVEGNITAPEAEINLSTASQNIPVEKEVVPEVAKESEPSEDESNRNISSEEDE